MSASGHVGGLAESTDEIEQPHGECVPRWRRLVRLDGRSAGAAGGLEYGTVLLAVMAVAAIAFGSHVLHGGYYLDDWQSLDLSQHLQGGGISGSIARQWDYSGFRPVSSIYRALVWTSPLGTHMRWNLAFALFSAACLSVLLYAVLRTLSLARFDAGAIALLVVACPLADSTRLWVSASMASLNIGLYLIGLLCAIRGLRAVGRQAQFRWHAAAAILYLSSVLFAESTAALIVATGLLYWALRGFRAALPRTVVDATLVVAAGLWISAHDTLTPRSATSLDALWSRAVVFAREAPSVVGGVVNPFGGGAWVALLAVLVLGAGVVMMLVRWPSGDPRRTDALGWLALALAGLIVAASAWLIYLPADSYYRPEQVGIGNRINALAAIGLILIAFSSVRIATLIVSSTMRSGPMLATALTGLITLAVLIGFARESRADSLAWNQAFTSEQTTLGFVLARIPDPPPNSMIYVVRQPQFLMPEVPIFVAWDFRPALQFAYGGARDVSAWAVPWSVPFHCERGTVFPLQWGWSAAQGHPYGNVWMVDVVTQQVWHITDLASCLTASRAVAALPMTRWVASVPNYPNAE